MLVERIQEAVGERLRELVDERGYGTYLGANSEELCEKLVERFDANQALLASSGSAALEIGLRACGVRAGDGVILSGYDYPGNFWAIERAGAQPVLVDTAKDSWGYCSEQLGQALSQSSRVKAVVASHLHGELQDSDLLRELCDKNNVVLIEDCCQAMGSTRNASLVGKDADLTILSFGGGKVLSAGRGGAVLSKRSDLSQKAKLAAGAGSGPYSMSELQASVVLAQLAFLDPLIEQTCDYFHQVNQEMDTIAKADMYSGTATRRWTMPSAKSIADGSSSLYQAGWLKATNGYSQADGASKSPSKDGGGDPQSTSAEHVPNYIGHGFPGFHRRSSRRCRKTSELVNAKSLCDRTLTVHHRVALEEQIAPSELAEQIIQALSG